ncbi:MAG: family 20 glycosylhydrolase [Clostridia bacterium]|nr:family 20 glycosylhydrolase [Clostridia bacterium]
MTNYERFGVMLDCSRNAVMKPEAVKTMIGYLARMGYNAVELYTEDTLALKDEPYFGHMRGRYTGAEIQEIDAYAREQGVELIPCIQTLAHFHTLVRHEAYADIVDMGDVLLIGEEKTYALIEKLFAFAAENFTSRNINIGMDEAQLVGLGKSIEKHGYQDPYLLLQRHLKRVIEIAEKYGFTPHMWSDMFIRAVNNGCCYGKNLHMTQEIKDGIPPQVKLAYWDYYHYEKNDYDEMFRVHNETGREVWFCGAAWCWCGFVPLWEKTLKTMLPAMQSVRENGTKNVLVTLWGDGGKECSFFAALPLLYAIRRFADGVFDLAVIEKEFYSLFSWRMEDFRLLEKVNGFNGPELYTAAMHLYNDCLLGIHDSFVEKNGAVPYAQLTKQLQDKAKTMGDLGYIFDCIAALSHALELKYDFGVRLRKAYNEGGRYALSAFIDECDEMVLRIEKFYQAFKKMWDKENKPFGFEWHTLRIGGVLQRIKDCKQRLLSYQNGEVEKIDELEETPLPSGEYNGQYLTLISAGRVC